MAILEQQLIISNKVISNDITTDPDARSLTMRNEYYVDSMYPDNRSTMTGENPFSDTDGITISKTAGQIG
tara:strand:+ start:199 stop:408 length:210 start_codon:yes stop_codon:yes gene_type:complete